MARLDDASRQQVHMRQLAAMIHAEDVTGELGIAVVLDARV
ncbi:MAG: hypothetical protein ACRC8S_14285 [Fimbriiglobus sp.]